MLYRTGLAKADEHKLGFMVFSSPSRMIKDVERSGTKMLEDFYRSFCWGRAVLSNATLWVALGLGFLGFEAWGTSGSRQADVVEAVDRLAFVPSHIAEATFGRTKEVITGAIGGTGLEDSPFGTGMQLHDRWMFLSRLSEIELPVVRGESSSAMLEAAAVATVTTPMLAVVSVAPPRIIAPQPALDPERPGVGDILPVSLPPEAAEFGLVPPTAGAPTVAVESVLSAPLPDTSRIGGDAGPAGIEAPPIPLAVPGVPQRRVGEQSIKGRSALGVHPRPQEEAAEPVRSRRVRRPAAPEPTVSEPTGEWSPFDVLNGR